MRATSCEFGGGGLPDVVPDGANAVALKLAFLLLRQVNGVVSSEGGFLSMLRYPLETIILILVILWLLGWLVVPIAGGLVHLLLVVVLVVVVIRVLQGRRTFP